MYRGEKITQTKVSSNGNATRKQTPAPRPNPTPKAEATNSPVQSGPTSETPYNQQNAPDPSPQSKPGEKNDWKFSRVEVEETQIPNGTGTLVTESAVCERVPHGGEYKETMQQRVEYDPIFEFGPSGPLDVVEQGINVIGSKIAARDHAARMEARAREICNSLP